MGDEQGESPPSVSSPGSGALPRHEDEEAIESLPRGRRPSAIAPRKLLARRPETGEGPPAEGGEENDEEGRAEPCGSPEGQEEVKPAIGTRMKRARSLRNMRAPSRSV